MTRKEQLLALADRVEALDGPSNEIDVQIALLRNDTFAVPERQKSEWGDHVVRHGKMVKPDRYTASLDIAMTLVLGGEATQVMYDAMHRLGYIGWKGRWKDALPRFITAAALRAQAEIEQ